QRVHAWRVSTGLFGHCGGGADLEETVVVGARGLRTELVAFTRPVRVHSSQFVTVRGGRARERAIAWYVVIRTECESAAKPWLLRDGWRRQREERDRGLVGLAASAWGDAFADTAC